MIKSIQTTSFIIFFLFFIPLHGQNSALKPHRVYSEKENGYRYGFIKGDNSVRIKPVYDTIYRTFRSGYAVVGKEGKAGLIDKKGKTVIPVQYDDIGNYDDNIIPVRNTEGLWGFFDFKGRKLVDFNYTNYRLSHKDQIIVQQGPYWGVINRRGKILLDIKYRKLSPTSNKKRYRSTSYNAWTISDRTRQLSTLYYDSIMPAGKDRYRYYMLGRYGLADQDGKDITGYNYYALDHENNGLYRARSWDKWGVINRNGDTIIPFSYDKILIDKNYIRVMLSKEGKERWGLFSVDGKELIYPSYPFLNEPSEGMIAARAENGIWRYIDFSGNTVIPFRFSEAGSFNNGQAVVRIYDSGSLAVIDKKGDYVYSPSEYDIYKGIKDQQLLKYVPRHKYDRFKLLNKKFIKVWKDGRQGLLSTTGFPILQPEYDEIMAPSEEGYFTVRKQDRYGIVNQKGDFTMPLTSEYRKIYPVTEGYARFFDGSKYGFVNTDGVLRISPQYLDTKEVQEGMLAVKLNGGWGFVDLSERLVVQPYYDEVWNFKNGAALVRSGSKYNLVFKSGEQLYEKHLDSIKLTERGNYLLYRDGMTGLAGKDGKEIFSPKYDHIEEAGEDTYIVKLRGLSGVLTASHKFILPIEYPKIYFDPFNNTFITGTKGRDEEVAVN